MLCLALRILGGSYPEYIITMGNNLNDNSERLGSKIYSLYVKILCYWFPPEEGYDITPQWTLPNSTICDDFKISFVVADRLGPLLLVEIKAPWEFRLDSGRQAAAVQISQRFDEIGPDNQHAGQLYAISAFGKKWKASYVVKGEGSKDGRPVRGVTESNSFRSFDRNCWNPDITSEASWQALGRIVEEIKGGVDRQRSALKSMGSGD
jgi:hypothetical protein